MVLLCLAACLLAFSFSNPNLYYKFIARILVFIPFPQTLSSKTSRLQNYADIPIFLIQPIPPPSLPSPKAPLAINTAAVRMEKETRSGLVATIKESPKVQRRLMSLHSPSPHALSRSMGLLGWSSTSRPYASPTCFTSGRLRRGMAMTWLTWGFRSLLGAP